MNPTTSLFDFDAMLMYGFVASADLRVCEVNQSLLQWISESRQETLCGLLERLSNKEGPSIREFIETLLDFESEAGAGDLFARRLLELHEAVEKLNQGEIVPRFWLRHEGGFITRGVMRHACDPNRILLATRMVKPGGMQMASGTLSDRVDLVGVCIVSREDSRSSWVVKGFQGQLQEAWLRLEPVIRRGNQTAAVALMSRNLSHNIGSHALFWLCQDTRDEKRRRFYAYLRDRMELLGSIATFMPLAFTTWSLRELIKEFSKNELFIERLCKSERVKSISIVCSTDAEVALPGGHAGVHLLYSILENTIRDSAKYARNFNPSAQSAIDTLQIRLLVDLPADEPSDRRFVRLTVCDDRGNYEDAREVLQTALDNLRIVDEAGNILHGTWGVKERFVCAVMLRGKQLEQIPLTQVKRGKIQDTSFGDYTPDGEPGFLSIRDINGNLGWEFSLLRPTPPILLIDGQGGSATSRGQVEVQTLEWLRININDVAAIRHRFVIFRVADSGDLEWLCSVRERLPKRLFLSLPEGGPSPLPGVPLLPANVLYDVSEIDLQKWWVDHLLMWKRQPRPVIVLAGSYEIPDRLPDGLSVHVMAEPDFMHWYTGIWPEDRLAKGRLPPPWPADRSKTSTPLIYIRSHTERPEASVFQTHPLFHFEPHERGDMLRAEVEPFRIRTGDELELLSYRLVEAALIRVLIVDERLDISVDQKDADRGDQSWRTILHWKGIDVFGRKYGTQSQRHEIGLLLARLSSRYYDVLILHMGIAEKIAHDSGRPVIEIYRLLQEHHNVGHLVVHSGRPIVPDLPNGAKFMLLSNVLAWVEHAYSKMQIVEELFSLKGA